MCLCHKNNCLESESATFSPLNSNCRLCWQPSFRWCPDNIQETFRLTYWSTEGSNHSRRYSHRISCHRVEGIALQTQIDNNIFLYRPLVEFITNNSPTIGQIWPDDFLHEGIRFKEHYVPSKLIIFKINFLYRVLFHSLTVLFGQIISQNLFLLIFDLEDLSPQLVSLLCFYVSNQNSFTTSNSFSVWLLLRVDPRNLDRCWRLN